MPKLAVLMEASAPSRAFGVMANWMIPKKKFFWAQRRGLSGSIWWLIWHQPRHTRRRTRVRRTSWVMSLSARSNFSWSFGQKSGVPRTAREKHLSCRPFHHVSDWSGWASRDRCGWDLVGFSLWPLSSGPLGEACNERLSRRRGRRSCCCKNRRASWTKERKGCGEGDQRNRKELLSGYVSARGGE